MNRLRETLCRSDIRAARFLHSLRTSLRSWTQARRRALTHPHELGIVKALRQAWLWSDPEFIQKHFAAQKEQAERAALREAAARRRAAQRARRLTEGPAVYEGELLVRPIFHGMRLNLNEPADLQEWLAQELGLDAYNGETVRVRLTAELLPGPLRVDE